MFEKTEKETQYGVEGQTITVVYNVPENLKGPPSKQVYSPAELERAIVVDEIGYDTLSEEWNEYIAEDGTKIRIKDTIVKVARTDKTDKNGQPIYIIQHGMMMGVTPARTPIKRR